MLSRAGYDRDVSPSRDSSRFGISRMGVRGRAGYLMLSASFDVRCPDRRRGDRSKQL